VEIVASRGSDLPIPIDRAEAMLPQAQSTAMGQSQLATHPVQ
jgi:hypothetical protein